VGNVLGVLNLVSCAKDRLVHMKPSFRHSIGVCLILLAHLTMALWFGILVPLGEAPDEVDHYAYIRHLMLEGELPVGSDVTQGKHPPLYFSICSLAASGTEPTFGFVRGNPEFCLEAGCPANLLIHTSLEQLPSSDGPLVMHLGRVISAALSAILVGAAYRVALFLFPSRRGYAIGVAGLLAFTPGLLLIGGAVSNDSLAAALSALVLLQSVRILRKGAGLHMTLPLGLLLGLGMLAKVGTLAVWPSAGFSVVWATLKQADPSHEARRGRLQGRRCLAPPRWCTAIGKTIPVVALGLAVASPWWLRNIMLYGDPLGWNLVWETVDLRAGPMTASNIWWLVSGLFTTWWGRPGGAAHLHLPSIVYATLGLICMISATGWVKRLIGRAHQSEAAKETDRQERPAIWTVLLMALVMTCASIVWYGGRALGANQARLMAPAFIPLAVLLYGGLSEWTSENRQESLAFSATALSLAFGVLVLVLFIRPAYAAPRSLQQSDVANIVGVEKQVFANGLTAVSPLPREIDAVAGQQLDFTLFWTTDRELESDLRIELWLVGPDGVVSSSKDAPVSGRFSTDLWPVGEVYRDVQSLDVPEWLPDGAYPLLVGVREFPSERWVPLLGSSDGHQFGLTSILVQS